MKPDPTLAKRLRCPTDDRPLLRLYYNTREENKPVTRAVPWGFCPVCGRVFPSPIEE